MTTDTFQRKLTANLSADVVGYSRLMGEDEEATVLTLNKYRQIIFDLIERHNGGLVDSESHRPIQTGPLNRKNKGVILGKIGEISGKKFEFCRSLAIFQV
jgi:class 3 adenylate cyclase